MKLFMRLIYNETEKMLKKKRLLFIIGILIILVPVFIYAQYRENASMLERTGTTDWRVPLQQEILKTQSRLNSSGMPEEWKTWMKVQLKQQQYYLEHDINPTTPGAANFTKIFIERSASLFLPLLILVASTDIVSGERADGTIKVLLTRPVARWKILLSKWITLQLFVSFILLLIFLISFGMSGIFFSFKGLDAPVFIGFKTAGSQVNLDAVQTIFLWQYLIMAYGLAWFIGVTISTISMLISVLVKTTAAAMGIMLSAIVSGTILLGFATSWEGARYMFSVNLQLIDYIAGQTPVLKGLSLNFSFINLLCWTCISLFMSFYVFSRQDIV